MINLARCDVFVDLCTQQEYLAANQQQRCANASEVSANVKHMMAFARLASVPVLSCVDTNRANWIGHDFVSIDSRALPQDRKTACSLLPRFVVVESDNCLCVPLDLLQRYQQVIFTKVHRDPFTNPKFDRLLTEMPAARFVVFGIPLESSLRMLVLGLIRRKRRVLLVSDSCGHFNSGEAEMVLRQLGVKGCEQMTAHEYLTQGLSRIAQRRRIRVRSSRSVA